jgi:VIT1/CCC1 family predicted Fe2+/Mn2+ transporter
MVSLRNMSDWSKKKKTGVITAVIIGVLYPILLVVFSVAAGNLLMGVIYAAFVILLIFLVKKGWKFGEKRGDKKNG